MDIKSSIAVCQLYRQIGSTTIYQFCVWFKTLKFILQVVLYTSDFIKHLLSNGAEALRSIVYGNIMGGHNLNFILSCNKSPVLQKFDCR